MEKSFVTALGMVILIVGGFIGLYLNRIDTPTLIMLVGTATGILGLGRKLDRVNHTLKENGKSNGGGQ